MASHNIVAIYPSRTTAERARDHLIDHGYASSDIRLSSDVSATDTATSRTGSYTDSEQSNEGFFSWLFGSGVSDEDRTSYRSSLTGERTAVSVLTDESRAQQVEDLLDQFSPIDLHEEDTSGSMAASSGAFTRSGDAERVGAMSSTAVPSVGSGRAAMVDDDASRPAMGRSDGGEEIIPVVEEQLTVGKRATERRYRVRTHVVEQPVEEQVQLRDERVVIERRPATGTVANPSIPDGQPRDFEIIERHEEPVVGKAARAVEEVVVKKEQADRVETVRDTVRRTEVEVDEAGGRDTLGLHGDDHRARDEDVAEERVPSGNDAAPSDRPFTR